jgi:hypothetical protein
MFCQDYSGYELIIWKLQLLLVQSADFFQVSAITILNAFNAGKSLSHTPNQRIPLQWTLVCIKMRLTQPDRSTISFFLHTNPVFVDKFYQIHPKIPENP